ncbi:SLATT domain-containing protein [Sorangium sp. So ce136]|uniref:SLATT domain-containing protein n=1 Tax=Sorangium sp. So ce136 TaxID=3133284 RepID=UPI003F10F214
MPSNSEALLAECKRIEENCLYTGQTHFEMASQKAKQASGWLVLLPSLVSAGSGLAVAIGAPSWIGAFAAVSGVVSGVATFLGVGKEASAHETAGKLLTQLRDEARALREAHWHELSAEQLAREIRAFGQRYQAYVASLPLTDNAAFEKVRKRVKSGRFQFDCDATSASPAADHQALPAADHQALPRATKDS